jgi:hypothetical protein
MWWKDQNLDKPIIGKDGKTWEFMVWHYHINGIYVQRIYFWDKDKNVTGIVELKDGNSVHVSKLKDKMKKLANDNTFRDKHLSQLKFPLEKNY